MFAVALAMHPISVSADANVVYYSDINFNARVYKDNNTGKDRYASLHVTIFGLQSEQIKFDKKYIKFRIGASYLDDEPLRKYAFNNETFSRIPKSLAWKNGSTIYLGHRGNIHAVGGWRNPADLYYELSSGDQFIFRAICGSFADKEIIKPWLDDAANSSIEKFKPYFQKKMHITSLQELGRSFVSRLPGTKVKFKHISTKPASIQVGNMKSKSYNPILCGYEIQSENVSKKQKLSIQKYLKDAGFYQGALDGIFGKNSCFALKNYLVQNKINHNEPIDIASLGLDIRPSKTASKSDTTGKSAALGKTQELQNELQKANAKIEILTAELKERNATSAALINTLRATEANAASHLRRVRELEKKLEAANTTKTSSGEKSSSYQSQLLSLTSTNRELEQKTKDLASQLIILSKQMDGLQSEYMDSLTTNEEKISEYKINIDNLSQKLSVAKVEIQELNKLKDNLNSKNTMLTRDLEEIRLEYKKLKDAKQDVTTRSANPRFSLPAEWMEFERWITPSQIRFCNILNDYEFAKVEAKNSGNQLLQNLAINERDEDIEALLKIAGSDKSGFANWIGLVDRIFAQEVVNPKTNKTELAAGIIIKTPCGVTMGTGRLINKTDGTLAEFKQLAFADDIIFSQLANLRRDEPILFNGSLLTSEATNSEKFITNELGNEVKTEAYKKPADAPDMFIDITYLAKL